MKNRETLSAINENRLYDFIANEFHTLSAEDARRLMLELAYRVDLSNEDAAKDLIEDLTDYGYFEDDNDSDICGEYESCQHLADYQAACRDEFNQD